MRGQRNNIIWRRRGTFILRKKDKKKEPRMGGKCLNRTNTATVLKPRGKDLYFAFGWVQSFREGEKDFSSCRLHLNTFIVDKQIFLFLFFSFFHSSNFLEEKMWEKINLQPLSQLAKFLVWDNVRGSDRFLKREYLLT